MVRFLGRKLFQFGFCIWGWGNAQLGQKKDCLGTTWVHFNFFFKSYYFQILYACPPNRNILNDILCDKVFEETIEQKNSTSEP